jgi:predicted RNA-binding protein Jag
MTDTKKTIQAPTLEDALARAAQELGKSEHDVHYRLIDEGRKGVMGIGQRDVQIEIDLNERAAPAPPEPAAERTPEVARAVPEPAREPEADRSTPSEDDDDRRGNLKRHEDAGGDDRRGNRRRSEGDGDDERAGGRRRRGRRGGRGGSRRRDEGGERDGGEGRGGRGGDRGRRRSGGERRREGGAPRQESGPPKEIPAEALENFHGTVQKMRDLMGLELTAHVEPTPSGVRVDLDGADADLVRDRDSEFQFGLQFVLNRMSRRAFPDVGRIQIGRGGPVRNEQRDEELIEEVREVASQVLRTGIEKTLHPMNPYERRLVHLTVREFEGLESESGGDGFLKPVTVRRP